MKELELNTGDLVKFRFGKEPYGNICIVSEKETSKTKKEVCEYYRFTIPQETPEDYLNEPAHYTCTLIDIVNNEKHILNKTHRWYKEDRQNVSLRIKKLTKV